MQSRAALLILTLGAALSAGFLPASVAAGDYQDVPCEELHLRIEGDGIYSQCQERHEFKGGWSARSEVIFAEELWGFTWLQRTVTDHGSVISRETPRVVAEKLSSPGIRDWQSAGRMAGYSVHRFRASTGLGPDSTCFYFERYEWPRAGGFRRRLVGVSCSSDPDPADDATVTAMLERIVAQ